MEWCLRLCRWVWMYRRDVNRTDDPAQHLWQTGWKQRECPAYESCKWWLPMILAALLYSTHFCTESPTKVCDTTGCGSRGLFNSNLPFLKVRGKTIEWDWKYLKDETKMLGASAFFWVWMSCAKDLKKAMCWTAIGCSIEKIGFAFGFAYSMSA